MRLLVIPLSTTLLHALLLCIPFTIFVLVSFWGWPRLWLHSLPEDIAKMAGPKTAAEQRATKFLLVPYLLILPGLSVASAVYSAQSANIDLSFVGALVHLYLIMIVVHVYDFAVIDFVHTLLIDPANPPIKGTEGARGWKDMRFHFRSLLKAIPNSAIFVVPAALLVSLFV
ncbi:MAG: hypothetical protein KF698_07810 [Anaerolineales bacterium]|nr:hypothetical protein [Anaerolineales bacterium]